MKIKRLTAITLVLTILFCFSFVSVSAADYSVLDVSDIQKHIAGLIMLSDEKQKEYDFNNDGILSILDSTFLQRVLTDSESGEVPTTTSSLNEVTTVFSVTEPSTMPKATEQTEATIVTEPTESSAATEPTEPTTSAETTLQTEPSTAAAATKQTEPSTAAETTKPTTVVYPTRISLNKTSLTLGIGEQYTLVKDTDSPDYPFEFVSGNDSIADVDNNGTITAKSCGTVFIACTSENGLVAVCSVTVKNMAQSITLNKTTLTLGVGENFSLTGSTSEDTAAYFKWYTSSNPDVASVVKNTGSITANKQGSATITCLLSNGVTAECSITVKAAPTSATLSVTSKQLKVGKNYTISESTNSGSYSYNFTWSSSNTKVATVQKTSGNKAQISPKMQGTATITFKTYNGKTASCKITVKGSNVKCLDVSYAQGYINFNKVKSAGYDYVIIRAGYGKLNSQKDSYFERNYKNAKAAGLKIGAYWYSYADSYSDALAEADVCMNCIKGKTFDLPIYYDIEEESQANLSKTKLTNLIEGFCSKLESNGYSAGVYATNGMYWNIDKASLKKNYSTWLAQIDGDFSSITDDIHQYTWTQRVSGISTNVDCNYIYNLNIVN